MEKLSVKDAMERLNVAETTIRRMIKRGDLPNIERENRKIWIPLSDIEAYEQKQSAAVLEKSPEPAVPSPPETDAGIDPHEPVALEPEPEETVAMPAPEAEDILEPEEAVVVSEPEPEESAPFSGINAEPHATIAQPFDELDDGNDSIIPPDRAATAEPSSEPAPYSPGAVQASGEHEQSFKWIAVQAGILSTTWLEEIVHSIRVALEKYKKKSFPKSSQKE